MTSVAIVPEKTEGAELSLLQRSIFRSQGWGEKSRGFMGRVGVGVGVRGGVGESHLEARDGAGFHEQHLEFQLHHAGQTHSRPQL